MWQNFWNLRVNDRLTQWKDFRHELDRLPLESAVIEINNMWSTAPFVNYNLDASDPKSWPDPWTLLAENYWCDVAKALGMCYTLLLVGVKDIKMVEATDMRGEDVILVLVDNAKYVLNYWPKTVVNNSSKDFSIKRHVDITQIQKKL